MRMYIYPISSLYTAWANPIVNYIILPNHLYFSAIYALLPAQISFLKHKLFPRLVELWRGVAVQFFLSIQTSQPIRQAGGAY